MEKKGSRRIVRAIIFILIVAALGYGGYRLTLAHRGSEKADRVWENMEVIIPGLGVDSDISTGVGRDPLAAVSIEEMDIVGALEIPAIDVSAPVTSENYQEEYFASVIEGSPASGKLMLSGGREDVFRRLSSLDPGDVVIFTDVDGVRYKYSVTTQYHLKKWDDGDNDLLLCSESDSDTYFVVGCTSLN